MATIRWAKTHVGTHVAGVKAGVREITHVINRTKERDGAIEEADLKRTLRGQRKALWSAVMGAYASAYGHIHHAMPREDLLAVLNRDAKKVIDADADGSKRYSVTELRALKNRGQMRLVEFAKVRKAK